MTILSRHLRCTERHVRSSDQFQAVFRGIWITNIDLHAVAVVGPGTVSRDSIYPVLECIGLRWGYQRC